MQPTRKFRLMLKLGLAGAGLALATPGMAQSADLPPLPDLPPVGSPPSPMSPQEVQTLPPEYRSLPTNSETTTIGEDGVETITRTRRIPSSAPMADQQAQYQPAAPGYGPGYAPAAPVPAPYGAAPVVLDRASWLAECRRRTEGLDDSARSRTIGSLIGAIGGGIIGNSLGDGDRLGETLLGAGVGAAAGALAGDAIGGDGDRDDYDCEDALESYLAQPQPARVASRTIPAPAYGYAQPGYPYGYAPVYGYGYAQPPQTVLVPIQTMQPQRVIVRETVREEMVPATRSIPPRPAPAPAPSPSPSPKMIKN